MLEEVKQLLLQVKDLLENLSARLKISAQQLTINALSDLAKTMGLIQAGEFRVGNGEEPGHGFTGVRMAYPSMTYGSDTWNLVGVNADTLQFGFSATTGKAYFCAGNAYIDIDGISGTDLLKWMIKQTATNSTYTRTGKLGMALAEGGGVIPNWQMSYESPASTELLTNGGAEEGDFTGWTNASDWAVVTTSPYNGTYCFRNVVASSVLTSDRIAVAAGNNYLVSAYYKFSTGGGSGTPMGTIKIELKYWDAATAGSQVGGTEQIAYISSSVSVGWTNISETSKAPTGATYAELVVTSTNTSSGYASMTSYVDLMSFSAVTVNQKLWLSDDGVHATDGILAGSSLTTLTTGSTAMGLGANSCVKITPNGNATYTTTVPVAGITRTLIILTSGTSSYTITFGTGFKSTGTLATGTTDARVFVVHWISDGTNLYEAGRTTAMVA